MERIRSFGEDKDLHSIIFFKPTSINYLSGYAFIPTERPLCLVVPIADEPWFYVPRLEVEHIQEKTPWVEVEHYFEYPDLRHPANLFVKVIRDRIPTEKKIGLESSSFATTWGYEGPSLTDILSEFTCELYPYHITEMRKIKDEEEIALIKESAKWCHKAHKYLQELTEIGKTEIDVSLEASKRASMEMLTELERFIPKSILPAYARYRGQIGEWSAIPHSVLENKVFEKGQVLVTGAAANISGYLSELERTMFIGDPTNKQIEYFNVMKEAQDAALATFAPNVKCSEVDYAARRVIKGYGFEDKMLHHTGHAIGMEGHEAPFLDLGVDETIKPGMVFTCEPGIYKYKFGGFRHSDTVIITEEGYEHITPYPREIEDLII